MISALIVLGSLIILAAFFVHPLFLHIGLWIAGALCLFGGYRIRRQRYRVYLNDPANAAIRDALNARLRELVRTGDNLGALKLFRQESGRTLVAPCNRPRKLSCYSSFFIRALLMTYHLPSTRYLWSPIQQDLAKKMVFIGGPRQVGI